MAPARAWVSSSSASLISARGTAGRLRTNRRNQKKNQAKLAPMMPVESFGQFDDVEMQALFSYLQSLPAKPFGAR